ncbi:MAG: hypothetical protein NT069_12810, partial [Planctomycetota bacterium]|nr:hypothetical protein [Planctomycetota bacterium]
MADVPSPANPPITTAIVRELTSRSADAPITTSPTSSRLTPSAIDAVTVPLPSIPVVPTFARDKNAPTEP